MRLAVCRARAALRVFATVLPAEEAERVAPHLRWLAAALGRVRDLDVHLAHLAAYAKGVRPFEQEILSRYGGHLGRLHEAAHRELLAALGHDDYVSLITAFRDLLTAAAHPKHASTLSIDEVARRSVASLLDRVHRRGHAIDGVASGKHLHRLRVDVKRLRFQLECLQGAYRRELDPVLGALSRLQERLGLHQDACMARAQLVRYRKLHAADEAERSVFRTLIRLERARARRHRERLGGDWQRFEAASADLPGRL
jgi:CHAD domain-containing protein